eukprot:TRINITY_DN1695_c0_g1_i4.p1 TRINITY_DN1695_c0_g1~~TRINITY_DN1695_c0_g1_i4.p1  ORF type:complete len:325 (-),score=73.20 TRINITY_DN1695_c0_g1_i4:69-1043(-)
MATVEHLVTHCFVPHTYLQRNVPRDQYRCDNGQWFMFNDMLVRPSSAREAVNFRYLFRHPCLLFFTRLDISERIAIPPFVSPILDLWVDRELLPSPSPPLPSFSSSPSPSPPLAAPGMGALVALDAEFVCVEKEENEMRDGRRVLIKPARLTLARVSVVRGDRADKMGEVLLDDYIRMSEPVVDYLTKYSGINPGDLDPSMSPHKLVPLKSAYLRLRSLVDQGVFFVGHGLKTDFQIINLCVPPHQIYDTVEIYHLPGQRLLSLKFLATHLLQMNIQTETHDSIEDARTALALYQKYLELKQANNFENVLAELYDIGHRNNWKV